MEFIVTENSLILTQTHRIVEEDIKTRETQKYRETHVRRRILEPVQTPIQAAHCSTPIITSETEQNSKEVPHNRDHRPWWKRALTWLLAGLFGAGLDMLMEPLVENLVEILIRTVTNLH